jgi:hypothetical protein
MNLKGSLGITGKWKKNGGVGRASPAQHPHIFLYFPVIPNEPLKKWGKSHVVMINFTILSLKHRDHP